MKRPWESNRTMVEEKITQAYLWHTAIRPDRWSLTSGLAGSGKDRSGSWATSKPPAKRRLWRLRSYRWPGLVHARVLGRMPGESSSMQSNSTLKIPPRFRSWRKMMSFLELNARAARRLSQIDRHVSAFGQKQPLLEEIKTSMPSGPDRRPTQERSRQGLRLHADSLWSGSVAS